MLAGILITTAIIILIVIRFRRFFLFVIAHAHHFTRQSQVWMERGESDSLQANNYYLSDSNEIVGIFLQDVQKCTARQFQNLSVLYSFSWHCFVWFQLALLYLTKLERLFKFLFSTYLIQEKINSIIWSKFCYLQSKPPLCWALKKYDCHLCILW